jgi:HNH endonuclease
MEFKGSDVLKAHKLLLNGFWDTHGFHKNGLLISRKIASPLPKERVLAGLIKMSEVRLLYESTHDRKNFDKRKHQKRFTGFKLCFACKNKAEIRHHIILIKNGGRNQKNNIVGLCRPCHARIHSWL